MHAIHRILLDLMKLENGSELEAKRGALELKEFNISWSKGCYQKFE